MTGAARLYSVDKPETLVLRALDNLTIAFHRPSGATHLLDSPLPEILAVLGDEPSSAGTILARLARDYVLEDGENLLDGVTDHLNVLTALGLVRVSP